MSGHHKWSEIRLKSQQTPEEREVAQQVLSAYAEHWRELHPQVQDAHRAACVAAAEASEVTPEQAARVIERYLGALHMELDAFSVPQLVIGQERGECRFDLEDLLATNAEGYEA